MEYILGPCDVALFAASISIYAPWLRQLFAPANLILTQLTICEMETNSNYVPVYQKLSLL